MSRKSELLKYFEDVPEKEMILQLVEEVIFLEEMLVKLKQMPFIQVHPNHPEKQRATPAARQYKEFLQQYSNCIKILMRSANDDGTEEESPLRKWMNEHINSK